MTCFCNSTSRSSALDRLSSLNRPTQKRQKTAALQTLARVPKRLTGRNLWNAMKDEEHTRESVAGVNSEPQWFPFKGPGAYWQFCRSNIQVAAGYARGPAPKLSQR